MDTNGIALIMLFIVAAGTGGVILTLSALIGRHGAPPERGIPYECGLDPVGEPHHRFSVKFFLIAVLFIIFDVEVVFLYPWARVFRETLSAGNGVFLIIELVIFLAVLSLALLYAWGRGALEWEE